MKVFVLFVALVAVTFAAICDNPDGKKDKVQDMTKKINSLIENHIPVLHKHCPKLLNDVLDNPSCNELYEEGFCYYNIGAKKYAHVTPENAGEEITFEVLAEGVPNAMSYGQNLCKNAKKCSEHIMQVGEDCFMKSPVDFLKEGKNLLVKAKKVLKKLKDQEPNSVLGRVAAMVYNEIEGKELEDLVSQATKVYKENEEIIMGNVLDMGRKFCDAKCVKRTVHALTNRAKNGLLDHLIKADSCEAPAYFCGECEEAAKDHFQNKKIPCCLSTVINAALKEFEELKPKMVDQIHEFFEASLPEEKAVYDSVLEQLKCYRDAYKSNTGKCSHKKVKESF